MRKLLFVLLILAIAGTSFAVINTPVVTALSTSYAPISIPQTNGKCRWVSAHTEDGTAFIIAVDASGTGEEIIPANTAYKNPCVTDSAGVVFYAKVASGTPNLAINYGANP